MLPGILAGHMQRPARAGPARGDRRELQSRGARLSRTVPRQHLNPKPVANEGRRLGLGQALVSPAPYGLRPGRAGVDDWVAVPGGGEL